jgi:predicted metal-dependent hydrolase
MQPDRILRSRRRTIAVEIHPDGQIWIRAPMRTPRAVLDQVLREKADWIQSRLTQIQQAEALNPQYAYSEGELHPFLGQQRPLRFAKAAPEVEAIYLPETSRGHAREALAAWYRVEAARVIPDMVHRLSDHFGLHPTRVRLSSARTRWGSCSSKGTISLAWRLILAPPDIIKYVIIHELVHLKVPNHSSKFWDGVQACLPDYKTRRAWLRKNARFLEV